MLFKLFVTSPGVTVNNDSPKVMTYPVIISWEICTPPVIIY